uniref:Uncharacterized protein n=1 Tax=Oryza rufipogon TaxID=4529 RepID=A0A0E0Q819_ORYRU
MELDATKQPFPGFLSCRERKGDFSCLTVAGICEASTSDAIGSGSWHSNAGSPCPISNSCAIYSSQWYGFQLGTARTQLLFKFFFPDVGWSPRNVGTCHSVRPGAFFWTRNLMN